MIFLESLLFAIVFIRIFKNKLMKDAAPFYIGAALLSCLTAGIHIAGIDFTGFFGTWIYPVFDKAALGSALFVLVMYAGAFSQKSKPVKILMPIRGQLSIIASILTLGHNIGYSQTYFVKMFANNISPSYRLAGICTYLMLAIMIPLWITSFRSVRKKMNAKKWKRLQRHAYGFYALLYIHVMLLEIPAALKGTMRCSINAGIYTFVFATYLAFRVIRHYETKKRTEYKHLRISFILFAILLGLVITGALTNISSSTVESQEITVTEIEELHDGTFTGTAFGYEGDITISLTIKDGEVVSGEITDYTDDMDHLSDAQKMLDRFLSEKSSDVDIISGATFTSNAVIKACMAAEQESMEAGK